jgi:uncharacterized protein (TIGR03382 family)
MPGTIAVMRTLGLGGVVALAVVAAPAPAAAESPPLPDAASATVFNVGELRDAMLTALPGDIIELGPGVYVIDEPLRTGTAGTEAEPIVVRVGGLGAARIDSNVAEAFKVTEPHWRFEHLVVHGTCVDDSTCEHAFHITGEADFTVILDCELVDFNAQIKGNGEPIGPSGTYVFPDDVRITRNRLYDTRPRSTANPVTKIDVVGGRRWTVDKNRIADFEKAGGDGVSYAAFLKGNSRDGRFLGNTVECADAFTGGTRIGLSLGGGGSGPDPICEDGTCTPEHQGGLIANNLIAHCNDVGIYLNEALDTRVYHNTIFDTAGIDVRYAASVASIYNNLVAGTIRDRDGGTHEAGGNLTLIEPTDWDAWFVDPSDLDFGLEQGATFVDLGWDGTQVDFDFCDNDRDDDEPDIGAIEYDDDVADLSVMCSRTGPPAADADPGDPGPGDDDGGPGPGNDGGGCCGAAGGDPAGALALAGALAAVLGRRRRA